MAARTRRQARGDALMTDGLPPHQTYADELGTVVEDYLAAGFSVIPLPARSKAAKVKGWQERTFTVRDFGPNSNVALRHDNGLCDVDLDWPEARTLAYSILPKSASCG